MPLVAKVRVAMNEVARTDDLAERSLAALATYAEERRQDKIISESRFLRGVLETQMSKIKIDLQDVLRAGQSCEQEIKDLVRI